MSKITFKSYLAMIVRQPDKQRPAGYRPEILTAPVHSFEVDGSSNPKIVVAATNERAVICQLAQARTHKNIIIYLQQGIDTPTTKLVNLSKSDQQKFSASVMVRFKNGETTLRTVSVGNSVILAEAPVPVGKSPSLLRMKFNFSTIELYDQTGDKKIEVLSQVSC